MSLFENSARVPLIIAAPGAAKATARRTAVARRAGRSLSDAGRPVRPAGARRISTAVSLRPVLDDPAEIGEGRRLHAASPRQASTATASARADGVTRCGTTAERGAALRHAGRPGRDENLAADPQHAAVVKELREKIAKIAKAAVAEANLLQIGSPTHIPDAVHLRQGYITSPAGRTAARRCWHRWCGRRACRRPAPARRGNRAAQIAGTQLLELVRIGRDQRQLAAARPPAGSCLPPGSRRAQAKALLRPFHVAGCQLDAPQLRHADVLAAVNAVEIAAVFDRRVVLAAERIVIGPDLLGACCRQAAAARRRCCSWP